MRRRIVLKLILTIGLYSFMHGVPEIKSAESLILQKKISLDQRVKFIAYPSDFCVLEDESIAVIDIKDQKVIIYDRDGRYLTDWRKTGQGPGEYQGIWFCSYQMPYLAIVDLRLPKVLLYERTSKNTFKWIRDIPEAGRVIRDFQFKDDEFCFETTILKENRFYSIHIVDLVGRKDELLLPAAVRYGGEPDDNYLDIYEAKYRKSWGMPYSFVDLTDQYVFSTWAGDSRIIRIDRKTGRWIKFGTKPKDFKPFRLGEVKIVDPKQIMNQMKQERMKYSWVVGILADLDQVGLLFMSYSTRYEKWETILQLYGINGVLKREFLLPDVNSSDVNLKYHYDHSGNLFFINTIDQEGKDIGFDILKYRIKE